jgi:hypothetical protein
MLMRIKEQFQKHSAIALYYSTLYYPSITMAPSILKQDLKRNDVGILTGRKGRGRTHVIFRDFINTKFGQFMDTSVSVGLGTLPRAALYKSLYQEWHACPYFGRFVTRDRSSPSDVWTLAGFKVAKKHMAAIFQGLYRHYLLPRHPPPPFETLLKAVDLVVAADNKRKRTTISD